MANIRNLPEVLTAQEAADALGIHRYTMYRLLREGKLKGFRITNRWRVKKEELERFIEGMTEDEFYGLGDLDDEEE